MEEKELFLELSGALCTGCKNYAGVSVWGRSPCSIYSLNEYEGMLYKGFCGKAEDETGNYKGRRLLFSNEGTTGEWGK